MYKNKNTACAFPKWNKKYPHFLNFIKNKKIMRFKNQIFITYSWMNAFYTVMVILLENFVGKMFVSPAFDRKWTFFKLVVDEFFL